jgi:hypothetical protein
MKDECELNEQVWAVQGPEGVELLDVTYGQAQSFVDAKEVKHATAIITAEAARRSISLPLTPQGEINGKVIHKSE